MEEDNYELRLEKQTFLRDAIISGGYDPASFKNYIESLREDGSNIDVWSMAELRKIVENFQMLHDDEEREKRAALKQERDEEEKNIDNEEKETIDKEEKAQATQPDNRDKSASVGSKIYEDVEIISNYKDLNPSLKQDPYVQEAASSSVVESNFSKTVNIKKIKSNIPLYSNIDISVLDPEQKSGGFFSLGRTYTLFKIITKPYGWEVKRRFKDFVWLRGVLCKLFPAVFIPPFKNKKSKAKDSLYMKKRLYYMTKFLNNISLNPDLFANQFVVSFLKDDEKAFEKAKRDGDNAPKPVKIEDMMNLEGKANLKLQKEHKVYYHYVNEFVQHSDYIYKKLRKQSKQLIIDIDKLSSTIFSIGELFAQLYDLDNEMNAKLIGGKNTNLADAYVSLNNMMVSWGNSLVKHIDPVQTNMTNFLKYTHHELNSYRELLKARHQAGNDYVKFKLKLNAKKEKLFLQGDISKWEMGKDHPKDTNSLLANKVEAFNHMCFKETQAQDELRDTFAYYNEQMYTELQRSIENKFKSYATNFKEFAIQNTECAQDMLRLWGDIILNFSEETWQKLKPGRGSVIMERSPTKDIKGSGNVEAEDSD